MRHFAAEDQIEEEWSDIMRTKNRRRNRMKRAVALIAMLVLALCIGIGGTYAWLTDNTPSITNTFTVGNIDIDLAETPRVYKMVPGTEIDKDPKVTVKANSEACWLFVKVEESTNLTNYIDYTIASGWTALPGVNGVYYREVTAGTTDQTFSVLDGDKVTVKNSVTKSDMDALTATVSPAPVQPTLTFTAYAVQKSGFESNVAGAWAEAIK